MHTALLMDNWTLQNAGELLRDGIGEDVTDDLAFSEDGQSCFPVKHPADLLRVEALFQVLQHVILAEDLWVEAKFTDTWEKFPPLVDLLEEGLIIPQPFRQVREEWLPLRDAAVADLCACPEVARIHRANVANYPREGRNLNPLVGILVWGGAGMLARAALAGVPYAPHPQRERLFARTELLRPPTPAAPTLFRTFVASARFQLSERLDRSGVFARFHLPAVAAQAILEANAPGDLLPVAMQLRGHYAALRGWLGEFQRALDAEDLAGVHAHRELLESVAREVEATGETAAGATGGLPGSETEVRVGAGFASGATSRRAGADAALGRRVQVRAQIGRLLLARSGRAALTRLLKLFGEENTARGLALERELVARFGQR